MMLVPAISTPLGLQFRIYEQISVTNWGRTPVRYIKACVAHQLRIEVGDEQPRGLEHGVRAPVVQVCQVQDLQCSKWEPRDVINLRL